MTKLWWVEDDPQLREIIDLAYLSEHDFNYEVVGHWKDCKPAKGDVVIYDLHGTGNAPEKDKSVTYYVCSGTNEDDVDLCKPFDDNDIYSILVQHFPHIKGDSNV